MKKEKNIVEQAAVPHRDKPAAALLVAMRLAALIYIWQIKNNEETSTGLLRDKPFAVAKGG